MIANPSYKATGCGCGGGGSLSAAPCGCGGADCASCQGQGLVRPQFFAGQLLTEDDLQLLTEYVGQKDRLHNRHLFGAGVVCGLEVTCHPCGDGRVIVHPGYALDCCGNDLTLTCAQPLDINGMIRDLRRDQLGGYDCGDPCPEPGTDVVHRQPPAVAGADKGKDGAATPAPEPLRYCLYISYCEQASDPVMPYSTGDDCGDLRCQATRVREGVKFELRCRPRGDAANSLLQRLCACLGDLNRLPIVYSALQGLQRTRTILKSGGTGAAGGSITQLGTETSKYFSVVRDWLLERVSNSPFLTDCTLRDKVYAMALPTLSQQMSETERRSFATATQPLIEVFINYIRDCLCRALNPACVPCNDSAVLLACLEVDECKVVKICNLERTFVLSPAAVRYWLPPLQLLGNLLERLCCDPLDVLLTDSADQSVHVGIGNLDMSQLLKQEVMRILEDSLCMGGSEKLRGQIDRIFAPKSDRSKESGSSIDDKAEAIKAAAARDEALKAVAAKEEALKAEVARTAAAKSEIAELVAKLTQAKQAVTDKSAADKATAVTAISESTTPNNATSSTETIELQGARQAINQLTAPPRKTRARKKSAAATKPATDATAKVDPPADAETSPQADAAAKVEPPADKPSKRVVGRIKTKRAKGAKK